MAVGWYFSNPRVSRTLEDILPTLEVMLGDCRCLSEHSKVGQEQPLDVFTLLASKSSQALISQ